jgi:hypothetical protein
MNNNFSIYLRLGGHYESNVLTASANIKTNHFVLRVCQLSSKPADQNHVTSDPDITNHCLTHICKISPILQKIISKSQALKR